MNAQRKLNSWMLLVVLLVAVLLAVAGAVFSTSQVAKADSDGYSVRVLQIPPTLTGKWWQWAYSIPAGQNPLPDLTGEFCDQGQPRNNVWFLAGADTTSEVVRECEVPARKRLFFPILNVVCLELDGDDQFPFPFIENPEDYSEGLEGCAEWVTDNMDPDTFSLTIANDEGEVLDLTYAIQEVKDSRAVKLHFPDDNIRGYEPPIEPNPSRGWANGYWAYLDVPPGEYTLNFTGGFDPDFAPFALDITYNLDIERK